MTRPFIALLFLFTVVAQSAWINDEQSGFRVLVSTIRANALSECAATDDTDQRPACVDNGVIDTRDTIDSVHRKALRYRESEIYHSKTVSVPLYQRYAAWLI